MDFAQSSSKLFPYKLASMIGGFNCRGY